MTNFVFANNVNTTLAGAISASATSLTLSSSAHLPTSIPAGYYMALTLNDAATRGNFEVIYVGAISGATCSNLLRGQEGTAALSWLTGDYAYSAPTDGQMNALPQLGTANTFTGANTFSDPVGVGAAVAAADAVNLGQILSSIATNGSLQIPSILSGTATNLIIQWGTATTETDVIVNFEEPFPNQCLGVVMSEGAANSATWGTGQPTVHGASNKTTTGFTHWCLSFNGSSWVSGNITCNWIAIGY